ncbi:MAG TPA: hypothetical protein VM509_02565 [Planctomycetota bacterium]|nr:hypothetical protein [Planctomycetota bacterium]
MKNRSLAALAAMIVLGAVAPAQSGRAHPAKGLDHVQLALDNWRVEHGSSWQIKFDDATGYARFLYGGSAAPLFTPHSDADYLALARQAARDTYELHGIEVETLVDDQVMFLPLSNAGSTDKMTVQFRQMIQGVPVEGGFLNVLFDLSGRILSVDTTALPAVAGMLTTPGLSHARGSQLAMEFFYADAKVAATDVNVPELVVYKLDSDPLRAVLCWKSTAQYIDDRGYAEGYTYFIDAHNGRRIQRENAIHHFDVSGTVKSMASPGTKPDEASNPTQAIVMPNMNITSPQGNVTADSAGNFNIVGATAPVMATFKFVGPWANVTLTSAGSPGTSTAINLTSASGNTPLLNPASVAGITAEANAFNWTNKLRDWTRSVNPADAVNDFQALVHTAVAGSCNAFFNGSSTNFYSAGGGCVNTSYADVVVHETGHWLNVRYNSGNGSDGFGEGNADNFALYLTDQPILGADFQGVGSMIRTGNNPRQFCGDGSPGCYGEVHNDGEVLMGACWKVRVNLKNSLGSSAGQVAANTIFNSWMNAYNDTQIKTIVETHWLTLDDNDGNIGNGTPNFTAIETGFRAQGFPQINLIAVTISNVTNLPDTTNTGGPYAVNADVVAVLNPPLTTVQLKYRLNGGPFATLAMSNVGGNSYAANIPGQPCPTTVEYYVTATNNSAQSATFPATSPGSGNLDFVVGTPLTVLSDNFQTDLGWTTSSSNAATGLWQRGVPVNDAGYANDPASDGDGSGQCYLTQNTLGNSDVDATTGFTNGTVTLTSPTMDMSSNSVTLSYKYFLNLTAATGVDRLLVEGNNNGGAGAWVQIALHTTNNGLNWTTVNLTRAQMMASGFTPSATSKIRFTANDANTQSIVEAAIDAVIVSGGISCQGACPSPTVYCTAKTNSVGCVPSIFYTGVPSATAPTGFFLYAENVRNEKPGLCLYTIGGRAAVPFQGGFLCVAAPVRRTPGLNSGGNPLPANDCTGVYGLDMNSFARGSLGGTPIPELSVAGTVVQAQMWGRDNGFSVPDNSSLSDGLEYQVCP